MKTELDKAEKPKEQQIQLRQAQADRTEETMAKNRNYYSDIIAEQQNKTHEMLQKGRSREHALKKELKEAEKRATQSTPVLTESDSSSSRAGMEPDSKQRTHFPDGTKVKTYELPKLKPLVRDPKGDGYKTPPRSREHIPAHFFKELERGAAAAGAPNEPPSGSGEGAVQHYIGTTPDLSSPEFDQEMEWDRRLPAPNRAYSPVRAWATADMDAKYMGLTMEEWVARNPHMSHPNTSKVPQPVFSAPSQQQQQLPLPLWHK